MGEAPRPLAPMTYFNPLIAPVAQGTQAQKAAAGKERQIARAQALSKNSATEGDTVEVEHQVESADGTPAVGEEQARQNKREREKKDEGDEGEAHIDVTA